MHCKWWVVNEKTDIRWVDLLWDFLADTLLGRKTLRNSYLKRHRCLHLRTGL